MTTTERATLEQLQRWAEADAKRLGLDYKVEVYWGLAAGGDGRGGQVPERCTRFAFRQIAHAHTYEARQTGVARICCKRGTNRDTIRHEVAHFVPGGDAHGPTHLQAMARLGVKAAKSRLVASGKVRCPKHQWHRTERVAHMSKVTKAGLVEQTTYRARCLRCGRQAG